MEAFTDAADRARVGLGLGDRDAHAARGVDGHDDVRPGGQAIESQGLVDRRGGAGDQRRGHRSLASVCPPPQAGMAATSQSAARGENGCEAARDFVLVRTNSGSSCGIEGTAPAAPSRHHRCVRASARAPLAKQPQPRRRGQGPGSLRATVDGTVKRQVAGSRSGWRASRSPFVLATVATGRLLVRARRRGTVLRFSAGKQQVPGTHLTCVYHFGVTFPVQVGPAIDHDQSG